MITLAPGGFKAWGAIETIETVAHVGDYQELVAAPGAGHHRLTFRITRQDEPPGPGIAWTAIEARGALSAKRKPRSGNRSGNAIIESTLPFAADWLDDGSGVELTAVDPHRALVAAAVDERGGVGIRFRPAAAILRQYGEQFRRSPRKQGCRSPKPPRLLRSDL